MANASNGHDPDQDPGVIAFVAKIINAIPIDKIVSYVKKKRLTNEDLKGCIGLAVFVVIAFVAGGFSYAILHPTSSASNATGSVPLGVSVTNVGLLDKATITSVQIQQITGTNPEPFIVGVTFPHPPDCDNACESALTDVLGPTVSCTAATCSAELEDVDEGGKDNSADIDEECTLDEKSGQKVLIMYSGRRDQAHSEFANILLLEPSAA